MIQYDSLAEEYDSRYTSPMCIEENAAVRDILIKYGVASRRTIDIGCGTGFALDCLDITRYKGIDISAEMIKVARRKYPKKIFAVEDIQKAGSKLTPYDAALSLFSIPYIGKESAENIYRMLKYGGICIAVYYNKPYLNAGSVYYGQKEMFNADVKPQVKSVIRAFKRRFETIEEHNLTPDGTYTVSVFRKGGLT